MGHSCVSFSDQQGIPGRWSKAMMRNMGRSLRLLGVVALIGATASAQAAESEGNSGEELVKRVKEVIQSIEVYRAPVAPRVGREDLAKSCRDLEHELSALEPMTYSYKPDFYEDPVQGTAFWVGTTVFWPVYGALGYTAHYEYQENERIYKTQDRIEELRRVKAEKRCFES